MGDLTRSQLETELRAGLGGRTDLDSRLVRCLNLAQQRLARMRDFDEMRVISSTQLFNTGEDTDRFLALPTVREVFSVLLVDGSNSRKVVGRTSQWFDRIIGQPEYFSRNVPTDYNLWGFNLEFFPMPVRTLTIRMRWSKWPTAFASDNEDQVSEFNQKDEVLIELALSYINRTLGKTEKANQHELAAQKLLAEAKEVDRTKPDENITPSLSDAAVSGRVGEPWNDPFVRDAYSRG